MKRILAIIAAAASTQAKVVFVVFAFHPSPAFSLLSQASLRSSPGPLQAVNVPFIPHAGFWLKRPTKLILSYSTGSFFKFFYLAPRKMCMPKCSAGLESDYSNFHQGVNEAELELATPWFTSGGLQPSGGFSRPGPWVPRVHEPPLLSSALLPGSQILGPTFLS